MASSTVLALPSELPRQMLALKVSAGNLTTMLPDSWADITVTEELQLQLGWNGEGALGNSETRWHAPFDTACLRYTSEVATNLYCCRVRSKLLG